MARVSLPYVKHVPFYAYLMRLNNISVGSIQKITINSDRQNVQTIREIGNSRGAEIKEFTWGGVDTTIDIERIELYSSSLMQALGYSLFYSLEDFNFTFDIQEFVYKADNDPGTVDAYVDLGQDELSHIRTPSGEVNNSLIRSVTYKDCIPIKWAKTIDKGTIHVIETMQARCRKIKMMSYSGTWSPEG